MEIPGITSKKRITYDHNGNILNLTRYQDDRTLGLNGTKPTLVHAQQLIDNLTYTYSSGNPLSKVEDATSHARGFTNGSTATTEYNYDVNGNLTEDKNKGISNIAYNFLGKPSQITFTDGKVITYVYDAAGSKLSMTVTKSGQPTVTTDYAGNFVYENGNLSFFGSPEGRVVKNGSNLEYQYSIADHQGNTRVVFSSIPGVSETKTANFESASNSDFLNYPSETYISEVPSYNSTPNGTRSQHLTGASGAQIGVAKSYRVFPGDKIKIEAKAKYFDPEGSNSNIAGFASALLSAYTLPAPAPGEIGTPSAALNSYGGLIAGGASPSTNNTHPKAFVNILIFDNDHRFIDIAFDQIDGGDELNGPHDDMMEEYTVEHAGYAYVYISNENPTLVDVYFDDVKMTHTKSNIVQYNEYYPFGLQTNNSWTRENSSNNFLYNAGNELNQNSGWYETFFRGYDPAIGRFLQVDPMSFSEQATYQYAANNPVYYNDPLGAYKVRGFIPNNADRLWHMYWAEMAPKRTDYSGGSSSSDSDPTEPMIYSPWGGNQRSDGSYDGVWLPLYSYEGMMLYKNKYGVDSRVVIDGQYSHNINQVLAARDATKGNLPFRGQPQGKNKKRYTPGLLDAATWYDEISGKKLKGVPGPLSVVEDITKAMDAANKGNKGEAALRTAYIPVSIFFEYEAMVAEGAIKIGQSDMVQLEIFENSLSNYRYNMAQYSSYLRTYYRTKEKYPSLLERANFWGSLADKSLASATEAYIMLNSDPD